MATLEEIARQVIAGKYGAGADRKNALTNAGYDYNTVQSAVNTLMGGGVLANGGVTLGATPTAPGTPSVAQTPSPESNYRTQIANLATQMSNMENKEKYNSKYTDQINNIQNQLNNRQFAYNAEEDPTYQQYKKDYTNYGRKAMEDTLGAVSARTGGLASSYAISASEQAYNNYMQQLASKIPELRQLAYQMYQNEGNDLQNRLNNLRNLDNTDYERWKDDYDTRYNVLKGNMSMYQGLLDSELAEQARVQAQAQAQAKASSGRSGNSRADIESKAKTFNNNDELYMYLAGKAYDGVISEREAEELYSKYAITKNLNTSGKYTYGTGANGGYNIYTQNLYKGK